MMPNMFRQSLGRNLRTALSSKRLCSSEVSNVREPLTVLTEDEKLMKDTVAKFAKDRVGPLVKKMEEDGKFDGGLISELFQSGLMGIEGDPEFGGCGASFFSSLIAIEELAKIDGSLSGLVDIHNTLIVPMMGRFGTREQKEKYLKKLCTQSVGSFCLSESQSGSDAFSLKTNAKADGNDFIINGSKMWISNADFADVFLVMANANPSAGYRGITCFIVERGMTGFTIGEPEKKMGLKASGTCPLFFDNVRVPKENILGELGQGYKLAIQLLNQGRIGIGAQMLGISQGCLDVTIPYTLERQQFGQPIFNFQGVQFQISQLAIKVECARLLTYNAARLYQNGLPHIKEASMAKYYASEIAQEVTSKCIDLMGGVGFTTSFPQEKFFRDCKIGTIYEGTSNIQLNAIANCLKKEYQ